MERSKQCESEMERGKQCECESPKRLIQAQEIDKNGNGKNQWKKEKEIRNKGCYNNGQSIRTSGLALEFEIITDAVGRNLTHLGRNQRKEKLDLSRNSGLPNQETRR